MRPLPDVSCKIVLFNERMKAAKEDLNALGTGEKINEITK